MWKKENQQTSASDKNPLHSEPKPPTIPTKKPEPAENEKRSPGYTALDRSATAVRKEALSVEPTVISAQSTVSGEISGQSDVRIFGNFQGSIEVPKNIVIVELSGYAKATINAKSLTIHGKLIGNVTGLDTVHLVSTGSVEGDIHAHNVILDKGSTFNGSIEMVREKPESKTQTPDNPASRLTPKPTAKPKPISAP